MSLKNSSRSESGGGAESLAVRIERALASLRKVELNLRTLQLNRLPALAASLALAASDLETLHALLPLADPHKPLAAALRSRVEKLGAAGRRVCALHAAAESFHAGLALARDKEAAAYDSQGAVHGRSGARRFPHALSTQG